MSTAALPLLLGVSTSAFAAAPAVTDPSIPQAAVTATPASIALGGSSTVVASAANTSAAPMYSVALGVSFSNTLSYKVVSLPASTCRSAGSTGQKTVYCTLYLPPGATAQLKLKVTPSTKGSYAFNAYARDNNTGAQTTATATLQVD